jgi:hypothetical protein
VANLAKEHDRMALHWYRAEVSAGTETHCYFGSSRMTEEELVRTIQQEEFVLLDDLTYFDEEGEARAWTEWDPQYLPRIHLNPKHIVSIMRLADDPRKRPSDGSKLLTYPGSKPKDDGEA